MGSIAFLTPLFLYGALGALFPLLLHLIKRERARKRVFSTIRFLKLSQHQVVRQQRLRRLLLLLFRMVACALLAMIFARPFLKDSTGAAFAGPQPQAIALVMDTSYSMGFGSRLDRIKRRARELIQALHPGDQVVLMAFSTQGHMIKELSSDLMDLESLIEDRVILTHQATNYVEALRMADDQLSRSEFEDRTIYLLSDFHITGWDRRSTGWKLSPGVKFKAIDVWDERDANVAVTDVNIPGSLSQSDRNLEIAVRVKNFGYTPFQGQMDLTINGRSVGKKHVSIPSQSGQVVNFRHTFRQDRNTGMISFGDDPLALDNRFYFTVDAPSPLRVLIVEEKSMRRNRLSAAYYIRQALELRPDPPLTVDVLAVSALNSVSLGRYQTVILADVTTAPQTARTRLTDYVKSGGGLIIGLSPAVSVNVFNTAFGDLLPGRIRDLWPKDIRRDEFLSLSEVNYPHPIFQPFAGPHHGDFGAARFFRVAHVRADSSAIVLGRYDDGSAAILEKTLGQGHVLFVTSTFNLTWNDLPIRGVFLPFLHQSVDYLAGRLADGNGRQKGYQLVGEAVRLPIPTSATVVKPSKAQIPVNGVSDEPPLFTETDEPGIYSIGPEGQYGHFAINLDTRESDLTHLDVEELVAAVINPVTESIEAQAMKTQASVVQNTVMERRQRLWWFLTLGLLIVVLGETFLASRTHR